MDDAEGVIGDDPEQHSTVPSFEMSPHSVQGTPDAGHSRTVQTLSESTASAVGQPQSRFPEHYYHGDDSGINESQNMGEGSNDDERHHQTRVVYPPVIRHSHGIPTRDAEENVQLTDETDYDRLVVEQLPSRGSLPVVSLSPGHSISTDYSKNWLPPLRMASETFISTVLREKPSQQQLLANDKRNQLLKFYIDEVAPWVSFSREVALL